MKPHIMLSLAVIALLILTQAGAQGVEWKVWVNPRQDTGLPKIGVELYSMRRLANRGYADEDGGYTLHIYFKTGPKIWWGDKLSRV
jgi:hypothetical protein